MPVARALHTNGCTTDVAAHQGEPSEKSTGIRTALKQIAVVHLRPRDALLLRCHDRGFSSHEHHFMAPLRPVS